MACGIGVCMTCVLPVIGDDGVTRMVRACTDGPVFRGERVRWADVGTIPPDAYGAPDRADRAGCSAARRPVTSLLAQLLEPAPTGYINPNKRLVAVDRKHRTADRRGAQLAAADLAPTAGTSRSR